MIPNLTSFGFALRYAFGDGASPIPHSARLGIFKIVLLNFDSKIGFTYLISATDSIILVAIDFYLFQSTESLKYNH